MSLSSPCEVCGTPDVRHTCDRCGRLVCADHYDDSLGFCVECAGEVGGGDQRIPTSEDMPDGVDVYRS